MNYLERPLGEYLDALASGEPTPGGGSAAALAGALAAALNSMVANFTVGREKFAAVEKEVRGLLSRSEELRAELQRLTQADTEAYGKYAAAARLPRGTDEEKAARREAMQEALRAAAEVPLAASVAAHEVIKLAAALADKGNPNLITDAGVAAKFGLAALECAALNLEINLVYLGDGEYAAARRKQTAPLLHEGAHLAQQVWEEVNDHLREQAK